MMVWPLWGWIGTPAKLSVWLANRAATWTGAFFIWKRRGSRRWFWTWIVLLNLASLASLILLLRWLPHLRAAFRHAVHVGS